MSPLALFLATAQTHTTFPATLTLTLTLQCFTLTLTRCLTHARTQSHTDSNIVRGMPVSAVHDLAR